MKCYRLDPNNLRRLTADEQRRLDTTPIDYSDIPPLDDEFFSKARGRILYALFFDGGQIGKAHTTRAAAVIEAYERGAVERRSEDFPGDPPTQPALVPGYEIRAVPGSS